MDWGKIVYPGFAAVFTALIFWGWDRIKVVPTIVVPENAVMSFDSDSCPLGWSPFAPAVGRTVVGAGKAERLTARALRETGGAETHTLTIPEMPNHNHGGIWGGEDKKAGMINDFAYHTAGHAQLQAQGGGQPHNNMQPFVALLYCKKQ